MGVTNTKLNRNEAIGEVSAVYRQGKNSTLLLSYEGAFGCQRMVRNTHLYLINGDL
ncbi:MAG: hypothetical protein LBV23_03560 [Deltaproteobacteria bacterium]|nr:hypothetical protein [Deltaproteobacteria bacterium]